jgi:hypothetical protein
VLIPGVGHWVAETAPKEMLKALGTFLAPYRSAPRDPHAVEDRNDRELHRPVAAQASAGEASMQTAP